MNNLNRIGFLTFPLMVGLVQGLMVFGLSKVQTGVIGLTWEAVVDGLVFLPSLLIYLLVLMAPRELTSFSRVATSVLAVVLIVGHAVHLAANQIHNVIDGQSGVTSIVIAAAYFWDELVGHWLTHIGLVGLLVTNAACIGAVDSGNKSGSTLPFAATGALVGLFLGVSALEGHSVAIYMAFGAVIAFMLAKGKIPSLAVRVYLGSASAVLLALFAFWYGVFGAFVEPLKVLH